MGSNQPSVRPFIVLIFSSGNARVPGNGNSINNNIPLIIYILHNIAFIPKKYIL